jgi:hypothetical protein
VTDERHPARAEQLWHSLRARESRAPAHAAQPIAADRTTPRGRAIWNLLLVLEDRAADTHNAPYARALLDAAATVPAEAGGAMIAPAASLVALLLAAETAAETAPATVENAAPQPTASPRLPMRLALQTEGAIGVYPGDFYNHLVGGRFDLVFSPHVSFGGYVGYANLKGKDGPRQQHARVRAGRVHGRRAARRARSASASPPATCRGTGRSCALSTGFAFPVSPTIDVVTELLAPMIWLTGNQMVISMDVAAEIVFRF